VLLVTIATVGYVRIKLLDHELESMAGEKFPKVVLANSVIDRVAFTAQTLRNMALLNETKPQMKEKQRLLAARKTADESIEKLKGIVSSDQGTGPDESADRRARALRQGPERSDRPDRRWPAG
jgi:hypothetical protein